MLIRKFLLNNYILNIKTSNWTICYSKNLNSYYCQPTLVSVEQRDDLCNGPSQTPLNFHAKQRLFLHLPILKSWISKVISRVFPNHSWKFQINDYSNVVITKKQVNRRHCYNTPTDHHCGSSVMLAAKPPTTANSMQHFYWFTLRNKTKLFQLTFLL